MVSISSHVAPRSPFAFAGRAGRAARALTTAVSALALAVGALTLAPTPALADDAVPSQDYFSYYPLDTVRAKGYTGKGVTIAAIGGPVDTSDPALKGANVTDKSRCTVGATPYQSSTASTTSNGTCSSDGGRLNTFASLINQAVEDGAQIISVSQSVSEDSPELKWAIANAISKGVIIVASAGNGASDDNVTHLSRFSGVVGVSAINADGTFASYSSWGDGVVTAAFGGPFNTFDPATNQPQTVNGTSVSAPLVAGMLALARQRWPEATTNQILQLLVRTGLNPNHNWDKYTGYGAAALGSLVNTDPSQYPDENPIIPKPNGSSPSVQEMQDYMDGIAGATLTDSFPSSYVYRGTDEGILLRDDKTITVHLGTSPRYHRK